jgi:tetratricopeptide (TPR) repeat protein
VSGGGSGGRRAPPGNERRSGGRRAPPAGESLRLSWALLLLGACVLVYANGLTGTFTYDDKAIIRDNLRLRSPERLPDLFATQYFGGPAGTGTAYRPLLLLSFAAQWWIHGGEPVAFHAANVLLHTAATLVLARLLLRLALPPPVAVGAALLFAVHPIHVEAVTSLVGRGETLAAVLVLGFLLCSLRFLDGGRRRGLAWATAILLYFAANLVKESAAVAPALLCVLLAWSEEGDRFLPKLSAALRRGLPVYAGAAAALMAVFWIRAEVLGGALRGERTGIFELENALAPLPPPARAANACAVFVRTLGRLAFPLRLSSDESAWSIRPLGLESPSLWAAVVLLVSLTAASMFRLGPRERSAPALGFLWLAVAALPSSNLLFPTGTIFAERLAYLPSAGFCLIAASWICGGRTTFDDLPSGRLGALAAAVILLSMRTIVRNPVWESDETLFTNMLRESPESAKAHYDYAYMSAQIGERRRALRHYTRATEIYPRYWDAWAGRGRMERELGDSKESLKAYEEALRIAPGYENGYFGVGLAYEDLGDRAAAERVYREGLRHNPRSLPLAFRLARILSADGRPEALFAWRRALAIEPRSAAAREGLREWELSERGRREAGAPPP